MKINGIRYVWFVVVFPCFEFFRGYYLEFPWLMPGTFFASNKYLLQSYSFVGSYSMNIALIIIVITPIVFFSLSLCPIVRACYCPFVGAFLLSAVSIDHKSPAAERL